MREKLEDIADHIELIEELNQWQGGRINQLLEENKNLGNTIARLQHSTGACEQIRKYQRIEKLESLVQEISDYLDRSNSEAIYSGSIFHREIKDILEDK